MEPPIKEYLKAKDVESSLANTPQITFEVTDGCNLKCKYCAYGEFYSDYDERHNRNLSLSQGIAVLEYLKKLWQSPMNRSYAKNVYISFYGGEPLLNMDFIKGIVSYVEKGFMCTTRKFTFSMTTNALLLDRYMNFLCEHRFNLLISLDGDEGNDSYRVNRDGVSSFAKVFRNVNLLRDKYPTYFMERVNFNSVLHNKNSVESIYRFFKEKYNKIPSIGELNTSGINPEKKNEFVNTYRNQDESLHASEHYKKIEKDMFIKSSAYSEASIFITQQSKFFYRNYNELLYGKVESGNMIPSGTCIPFSKKVFVTVNGKILPCEKIGQQYTLGRIEKNEVKLDFDEIAEKYNVYYSKLEARCRTCYNKRQCKQCIFNLEDPDRKPECYGHMTKSAYEKHIKSNLAFFERNPEAYGRVMKEIQIR